MANLSAARACWRGGDDLRKEIELKLEQMVTHRFCDLFAPVADMDGPQAAGRVVEEFHAAAVPYSQALTRYDHVRVRHVLQHVVPNMGFVAAVVCLNRWRRALE